MSLCKTMLAVNQQPSLVPLMNLAQHALISPSLPLQPKYLLDFSPGSVLKVAEVVCAYFPISSVKDYSIFEVTFSLMGSYWLFNVVLFVLIISCYGFLGLQVLRWIRK
jgi:hypothetical protein